MTDLPGAPARRPTQRLTPDRVRSMRFSRTPIGRRGVSEEEVGQFLHRVAEDLAARDAAEASLRAKAQHYKNTLVQWQREQDESRDDDPAETPTVPRPPVEAVNILSRAQQEADAYIAQTQEYCRRLTADAERHADEIVDEARTRASVAAVGSLLDDRTEATQTVAADLTELDRRLTWARAFITSLEAVETQLRAAREALAYEFDRLDGSGPRGRDQG
ncbi:MAG TPA: DivIVA domain-containing protein [Acidimicrobiales bacterium]